MTDDFETENNVKQTLVLRNLDPMEVLDFNGACEYLHCSRSFLFRLMNENELPFKKVNGKLMFVKSAVYEWLKNFDNTKQCDEIG